MASQPSRRDLLARLAGAGALASSPASAQGYPSKPIHIIVPFAAGGITDVIGRALAQRLSESLGQQVVLENKPGGGTGQVGTEYVARAAPDGYTLLVTADATFITAPHVYSKLPYDALNDFVPITALGISPQALVVHPSLPCAPSASSTLSPSSGRASSTTARSASARADTSISSSWSA